MSTSTFASFGPTLEQAGVTSVSDDSGNTALFDSSGNYIGSGADLSSGQSILQSQLDLQAAGFSVSAQPVDPNNTGDTGGVQNTSTPPAPSQNNPETAGNSSLGTALGGALNAAFAGWQLASQPAGTPKTVTTKVGNTTVTSGAGASTLTSILGPTAAAQQSTLLIIIIAVVAIYWLKTRG